MFRHGLSSVLCASVLLCLSCDSRTQPQPATPSAAGEAVDEIPPPPQKLTPPPGPTGPFLIRIDDALPSQIFTAAATSSHIAIAMQSDIRDIEQCPETQLPICFKGTAVIAQRANPNTHTRVPLYESDTQSGARVDDIAAAGSRFAFAVRNGIYVGDDLDASIIVTDSFGNISQKIKISSPMNHVRQIALDGIDENTILACYAVDIPGMTVKHEIQCETVDLRSAKRTQNASVSASAPVRALDIKNKSGKYLAVWNADGHTFGTFLHKTSEIADFGLSTALRPVIAAGLKHFAVAWQGDDAAFRVEAVDPDQGILKKNTPTLFLNGVKNRSINGMSPVSDGYLFAFRHDDTQQVAIIAPDFKSWELVENSKKWRMFADYGTLNIQDAHTGKFIWQTAESLVQKK